MKPDHKNLGRSPPAKMDPEIPLSGTPTWITPELIAETLDCWKPIVAKRLTTEEAVEILLTVGRLFDALEQ